MAIEILCAGRPDLGEVGIVERGGRGGADDFGQGEPSGRVVAGDGAIQDKPDRRQHVELDLESGTTQAGIGRDVKLDQFRKRVPIPSSALGFEEDQSRASCIFDYETFANNELAPSLIAEVQGSEFAFSVGFFQLRDAAAAAQVVLEEEYPHLLADAD